MSIYFSPFSPLRKLPFLPPPPSSKGEEAAKNSRLLCRDPDPVSPKNREGGKKEEIKKTLSFLPPPFLSLSVRGFSSSLKLPSLFTWPLLLYSRNTDRKKISLVRSRKNNSKM